MRSPSAAFNLGGAIAQELNAALHELEDSELNARAIHGCRVRLKRARAYAQLGKPAAPGLAAIFDTTARIAMQDLAPMRDLAALSDLTRTLAASAKQEEKSSFIGIADTLDAEAAALPPLDAAMLRSAIKDLIALAKVWPDPSPRQLRLAARRINKRARRARVDGIGATDSLLRHRWRRREKTRLYAAKLLSKAWPGRRLRRRGENLCQLLGLDHDATLLLERLKQDPALAGAEGEAARARRVLRAYRSRMRKRADKLARRS